MDRTHFASIEFSLQWQSNYAIHRDKELVITDINHPLSRYPLTLETRIIDKWQLSKEHGGECNNIASTLTSSGPGMQIPYQMAAKNGYAPYPFN